MWSSRKRRRMGDDDSSSSTTESANPGDLLGLMASLGGKLKGEGIRSDQNHIYFNEDITSESIHKLNAEIQATEKKMLIMGTLLGIDAPPIYLHLNTYGGSIHAAFSCIDTIKASRVPIYTVVEGFVASAGTLISVCGVKRYIRPNAYMLIHQLRSELWGKMADIEDEASNLKKLSAHLLRIYDEHTELSKKELRELMNRELEWNADECLKRGFVDEVYK